MCYAEVLFLLFLKMRRLKQDFKNQDLSQNV
jgi:hypothetical protein